jgi:predicted transcriptional regulator
MSETIFKIKVDDFLARRVKDIIRRGSFRDEDAFFRGAIEKMVRVHELRELDEKMDKFSRKMDVRHPMSIHDAVLAARAEEDDEL